ncbi:MAG TPA: DsrE family protein [Caulobacteraceae bacterium]|jgi:intracellular sulfur oxidation DsrE/DsrF family protein|nr:DsrE family protein [Caulobacteraceae bacterium]
MRLLDRFAFAAIAMTLFGVSSGAFAGTTAPVPAAGVMADIPGAHETPDPRVDYKVVFDVQSLAESSDQPAPALKTIGVLLNTYRRYGVPADHLHFVAVFHGRTIVLVANDETYRARTGAPSNPNDEILRQLSQAGVRLAVCGQSARAQHYDAASLQPLVQMNLSATVTFIDLQTGGYVRFEE